jgi:hypothetical protein
LEEEEKVLESITGFYTTPNPKHSHPVPHREGGGGRAFNFPERKFLTKILLLMHGMHIMQ